MGVSYRHNQTDPLSDDYVSDTYDKDVERATLVNPDDRKFDGGWSSQYRDYIASLDKPSDIKVTYDGSDYFEYIKRSYGLYERNDIDLFNRYYRFGIMNPYESVSTTKEYLFFTKPDLNIFITHTEDVDKDSGVSLGQLNPNLSNIPFWRELVDNNIDIVRCLEDSYTKSQVMPNRFNYLLTNSCISNLSIPGLDAETIDTPNNDFGVGYSYRGSSEASNDNYEFDLEFKDNMFLDTYLYFKAYEEYETLKTHGLIAPALVYIQDKIIHDQFSIYKFLVGEDGETIIYYCKFFGVMPKSLPRDVFSSATFDNGLSYSISFKAAFFDDKDPQIIADFNSVMKDQWNMAGNTYDLELYNTTLGRTDNRPAVAAKIVPDTLHGRNVYKLKFRGRDQN